MKPLFFCNTYYQLIVAIQLKLTVFIGDEVGVCLTDHSAGAEMVIDRLRKLKLFSHVFYWPNNDAFGGSLVRKVNKLFEINRKPKRPSRFGEFNALVFFNISYATYEIVNELSCSGNMPTLFRMEEGLITCSSNHSHGWRSTPQLRLLDDIWTFRGKPRLGNQIEGFYCFLPRLCDDEFPIKPLRIPSPATNRSELSDILTKIFGFKGFPYDQKYIFFASSLDVDGRPTGESEIVLKTASEVGAENLLVKMHPRDERQIYQQAGIEVMARSSIPWEVVQLCEDLSNRVLLTCTSGAPLTISALLDDGTRGRYIKPLEPTEEQMANYRNAMLSVEPTLERLHSLGLCKDIFVSDFEGFIFEVGKEKPLRKEGD